MLGDGATDPISQRFERGGVAIALNVLLAFSYILKAVLAMAVLNGYVQRIALPNFDRYRWPKVHFKADIFQARATWLVLSLPIVVCLGLCLATFLGPTLQVIMGFNASFVALQILRGITTAAPQWTLASVAATVLWMRRRHGGDYRCRQTRRKANRQTGSDDSDNNIPAAEEGAEVCPPPATAGLPALLSNAFCSLLTPLRRSSPGTERLLSLIAVLGIVYSSSSPRSSSISSFSS